MTPFYSFKFFDYFYVNFRGHLADKFIDLMKPHKGD